MDMDFKGKRITVMGLGLYKKGSGIEAAKFFLRRGAKVTVTDLRSKKELTVPLRELSRFERIHLILGRHRARDFEHVDFVFQNPSVPATSRYLKIAKEAGIPILNDWSIFLSEITPGPFVGVTGTRGKSTATALIHKMMSREYGNVRLAGNLGVSPLSFMSSYKKEPLVAELSSWLLHHFPQAKKSPSIAVVTNILNDHLDKYKSKAHYIADKEHIFRFQKKNDAVILNADDPTTRTMAKKAKGKVVWFSQKRGLPRWVPVQKIKLVGEHNQANALAAAAAAERAGVSRKHIIAVLKSFKGLPDRLERIATMKGIAFYNDTTATTPDATIAALKALKAPIVLICGGKDKKLDYKELADVIAKSSQIKKVVLLTHPAYDASEKIFKALKKYHAEDKVIRAANIKEAVKMAYSKWHIANGKNNKPYAISDKPLATILLSPAAASFGMFQNEFDRGDQFVKEVRRIKNLYA